MRAMEATFRAMHEDWLLIQDHLRANVARWEQRIVALADEEARMRDSGQWTVAPFELGPEPQPFQVNSAAGAVPGYVHALLVVPERSSEIAIVQDARRAEALPSGTGHS